MNLRVLGRAATDAAAPTRSGVSVQPGTAYLRARADAWHAAQLLPEIEPLRANVAALLRAEKQERQNAVGLIGTAYHLIERTRVRAYRTQVKASAAALQPFRVHVSGPWAPYAFAPESTA
jgi:hypothetical protein